MYAKALAVLVLSAVVIRAQDPPPVQTIKVVVEIRIVVVPQPGPGPSPIPPDPVPPPPQPNAALVKAIREAALIESYTGLDGLATGFRMCAKAMSKVTTTAELQTQVRDTLASVTPLGPKLHALLSKELNANLPAPGASVSEAKLTKFFEDLGAACEAAKAPVTKPRAGIEESSDKDN